MLKNLVGGDGKIGKKVGAIERNIARAYGFIKVVKLAAPADQGIEYKMASKAADVPK